MSTRQIKLPNGNVEYRNEFGELHNPEGPAKIPKEGYPEYRQNGVFHSIGDKPARAFIIDNGKRKVTTYLWYKRGELHRDDDNPASVTDRKNGLSIGMYAKNGYNYSPPHPQSNDEIRQDLKKHLQEVKEETLRHLSK